MSTANPRRTRVSDDPNWPMLNKYRALLRDAESSTNNGTNIGSTAPVSASQDGTVGEPTYALTGLTGRHVAALRDILRQARPHNSAQVEVIAFTSEALSKIDN